MKKIMEILEAFGRHTRLTEQADGVLAKKWLLVNVGSPADYRLLAGPDYDLIRATTSDPPLETYREAPIDPTLFVDVMKRSFQKGQAISSPAFRKFVDSVFPAEKIGNAWGEFNNDNYWKPRAYFVALAKPNFAQLAREIFRCDMSPPASAIEGLEQKKAEGELVKKLEQFRSKNSLGEMAPVLAGMNYVPLIEASDPLVDEELPIEHQAFGDSNVEEGVQVLVPAEQQPPQWVDSDASHPTLQSFRRKGLINAVASPQKIFKQMLLSLGNVESNADVLIGRQRKIPSASSVGSEALWNFCKDKIFIEQGAIDRESKEFKSLPKSIRQQESDTQVIATLLEAYAKGENKPAQPLEKAFVDAIVRGQK